MHTFVIFYFNCDFIHCHSLFVYQPSLMGVHQKCTVKFDVYRCTEHCWEEAGSRFWWMNDVVLDWYTVQYFMPYLRHFQYLSHIRTTQVSKRELRCLTNTLINIYILRLHNIMQQYNGGGAMWNASN